MPVSVQKITAPKQTIQMLVANHNNRIHGRQTIDLGDFASHDVLLDVTATAFPLVAREKVVQNTATGETFRGREVTQILDLEKQGESNPLIKDGFQAYAAVIRDGRIIQIGLPMAISAGTAQFLNADQTTVKTLRNFLNTLPEGAELAIIWRRDVDKIQDVTSVNRSEVAGFTLPEFQTITCGGGIGNSKIETVPPIMVLYSGSNDDRIQFAAVIPTEKENAIDFTFWDAGILPALHLQSSLSVQGPGVAISISGAVPATEEKYETGGKIAFSGHTTISPSPPKTSPASLAKLPPPEESMIMRLIMNPAERKIWGKLYGFPDEEAASPQLLSVPLPPKIARTKLRTETPAIRRFKQINPRVPRSAPLPFRIPFSRRRTGVASKSLPTSRSSPSFSPWHPLPSTPRINRAKLHPLPKKEKSPGEKQKKQAKPFPPKPKSLAPKQKINPTEKKPTGREITTQPTKAPKKLPQPPRNRRAPAAKAIPQKAPVQAKKPTRQRRNTPVSFAPLHSSPFARSKRKTTPFLPLSIKQKNKKRAQRDLHRF